jgi:G:T/U-mismatch repair DNA glycosylase
LALALKLPFWKTIDASVRSEPAADTRACQRRPALTIVNMRRAHWAQIKKRKSALENGLRKSKHARIIFKPETSS